MSNIREIVEGFFRHDHSSKVVAKVHARLSDGNDVDEKEILLKSIWDEVPMDNSRFDAHQAYQKTATCLGFLARPHKSLLQRYNWLRHAALWFIPLFSILFSLYMYKKAEEVRSLAYVKHYVPYGQRQLVKLPDQTHVWLNGGSLLIYPNHFQEDKRDVYLSGEGFFSVTKDDEIPFVVQTTGLKVLVLGTKFNLSAYPDANYIHATLNEGSIRVLTDDGQKIDLKPNQQLYYDLSSTKATTNKVDAEKYSAWVIGGLRFEEESFDAIMKKIEKRYGVKVTVLNSERAKDTLTITFNENESLTTVLLLVKNIIPNLDYKIEGKNIYIK